MKKVRFSKMTKIILCTGLMTILAFQPVFANVSYTSVIDYDYPPHNPERLTDQWVRYTSWYGSSVWNYVDSNGNYLVDTVTPDGYMVNSLGNLYTFCPSAEIVEVDEYDYINNNGHHYPFSFDGTVVKNDYLGISCLYNESDYTNGYVLTMYNGAGSMDQTYFEISSDNFKIRVDSNNGQLTPDYVREWAEWTYELGTGINYVEMNLLGKNMFGRELMTIVHSPDEPQTPTVTPGALLSGYAADSADYSSDDTADTSTVQIDISDRVYIPNEYELYYNAFNGLTMKIEIYAANRSNPSPTFLTDAIAFLNTHMTISK